LAIPVETKNDFECPAEHLAVLREFVPKVTKILIVGWRATEAHFLKLLVDNLKMDGVRIMAVSGGLHEAGLIRMNLQKVGIDCWFRGAQGGFTKFIETREGDEFLKA
jgi:hypothetical protein